MRILASVSTSARPRASSAALAQLCIGTALLLCGVALGWPGSVGAVLGALVVSPVVVTWWAAVRSDPGGEYVAWWRRPGW